jgi:ABC-2 type transport system permease protein
VNRILDICTKDLMQIMRDRMTFLFLLAMPIVFTFLFGSAFGGGTKGDPRLPVGYLDQDHAALSQQLGSLLGASTVIRHDEKAGRSSQDLEKLVTDRKLAAAIVVPVGYSASILAGIPLKLTYVGDPSSSSASTVQGEVLGATKRLWSAVQTAQIVAQATNNAAAYDALLTKALAAWQRPPIQVSVMSSSTIKKQDASAASMAHSSPAMMLQFAIAGLLTAATVIVNERRSRSLARLLTTSTSRPQILLGHYLAIFAMILGQFVLLIAFGQLAVKVDYLRVPPATLLIAVAAAACVAAMGLLIGMLARSHEQAIVFSLIPMFVLSGLGGAWVPLEFTGAAFRAVGHVSPVAWAMDGFENITARGLGFSSALLPAAALASYAILFFSLAAWRFHAVEER